jgi:hypothetical protein
LQRITGQRLKCDAELLERWWAGGGDRFATHGRDR